MTSESSTTSLSSFKTIMKFILVVALVFSFAAPSVSFAQSDVGTSSSRGGPRRQLATILFAGLGGAVLGLSTLSFYGRPQDHLANIALGFAGGVILGTTIVTYRAATNPGDFYGTRSQIETEMMLAKRDSFPTKRAPIFSANFEF